MKSKGANNTGIIVYFIRNPVVSNLMMLFFIIIGFLSFISVQKQMFPNVESNEIIIEVSYPGAAPREIEESILLKIEEAIKDVTEIEKSISEAFRDKGNVKVEVEKNSDLSFVLDKIKLRIDRIAIFPADMEPISIYRVEFQQDVAQLSLVGDIPLWELKPVAQKIENELQQLQNVSLVNVNLPVDEIAIEIQPSMLRKYNLSFDDVTQAINKYSTNVSAGQLRTETGIISIRIQNQYYRGRDFSLIPVKIASNGAKVLLQDVAVIKDGFVEGQLYFKYSGRNAISIDVKATKDQDMTLVAQSVRDYVVELNKKLPNGVKLNTVVDMTYYLNERLDMMLVNLLQGAILVGLLLSLFLRVKLALWVMLGLPVCFLGAVMMMPAFGITLNIVSLFAFIMVLGVVVDDATVIGESIYTQIDREGSSINSVINGTQKVATPATFGVLTTMAIFAPFAFSTGPDSSLFFNIATVTLLCLFFSLVESKLILPSHIAQCHFSKIKENSWRFRFNRMFSSFINGHYQRFIQHCLNWHWLVLSCFIGLLIISFSLISANHVRVIPTPKIAHDFPVINIEMNSNVSDKQTIEAIKSIENVIWQVEEETKKVSGKNMIKDLLVIKQDRTKIIMIIPLVEEGQRPYDTFELSRRWRENFSEIAGLKSMFIQDDVNSNGKEGEFGYLLYGSDIQTLNAAGRKLISMLQNEKGLYDISSSIDPTGKGIQLSLLPVAYDLGIDLKTIASQMSTSFYGGEVQRLIRNGEEIRVMVRYPELTRSEFSSLKHAIITTPEGKKVVLGDIATLKAEPSISHIRREGGNRTVYVYGAIDEQTVEPNEAIEKIENSLLVTLKDRFPNVKTELGGVIQEQKVQLNEQSLYFIIGMIIIYILLAVPLKSYTQPLIIMSIIPFSLTGAIWGHLLLNIDLSIMSFFGIIAATGVVINDSLVMVDNVNQSRNQGVIVTDALINAGCIRFKAIFLTSITTFAGVLPIMLESSLQAQFVVPMAVSLGFSVLFSAIITLILLPCLYLIGYNMVARIKSSLLKSGKTQTNVPQSGLS